MLGLTKVFCRVAIWRRIATADMTAAETGAQVDPVAYDLQAVLASVSGSVDVTNGFGRHMSAGGTEIDVVLRHMDRLYRILLMAALRSRGHSGYTQPRAGRGT